MEGGAEAGLPAHNGCHGHHSPGAGDGSQSALGGPAQRAGDRLKDAKHKEYSAQSESSTTFYYQTQAGLVNS